MTDSTPGPPPPPPSAGSGYPVTLDFERGFEVAHWRPLVNWLLVFPQVIVLYVLGIVAWVLWLISFFTILFTKRNPFVGFQAMVLRYQWRVQSFAFFMRHEYPPFEFETIGIDPATDAARVSVQDPEDMSRWLIFVKWLLAIPHLIVLVVLSIGVFFVWIVAFFAVLFTGKWPVGMRNFVVGFSRWSTRVSAYLYFLTDAYPPFSLE
jgi:hypothetical protein